MAEKKSFVMYYNWGDFFTNMTDEEVGQVIRAIYALETLGIDQEPENRVAAIVYTGIRQKLLEDIDVYKKSCDKRAEASAKGVEARRRKNAQEANDNVSKPTDDESSTIDNDTLTKRNQMVSDTDTDTDTENDTDTEKEKRSLKPSTKVSAQSDLFDHSEPQADVEAIPLNDGSEWRPTQAEYEEYCRLYPAVDVKAEIAGMRAWCLSNPKNKKTKGGVKRFLNGWLAREQNKSHRGRDKPSGSAYLDRIDHRLDVVDQWAEAVGAYGGGQDDGSTVYPFG